MTYMPDGKPAEAHVCEISVGDDSNVEGDGFETVHPKLKKISRDERQPEQSGKDDARR